MSAVQLRTPDVLSVATVQFNTADRPKRKCVTRKTKPTKWQHRDLRRAPNPNASKKSRKIVRAYDEEDVRRGLSAMVSGASTRKAEIHTAEYGTKVPRSTLKDLWSGFFGFPPNAKLKFGTNQCKKMLGRINNEFKLPDYGRRKYFLEDEEEMIMQAIEMAHTRGFPYDRNSIKDLATNMLKGVQKDRIVGRKWLHGFERRYKERLCYTKCSTLDEQRAQKATKEVRDQCYLRFMTMIEELQSKGLLTDAHLANLGRHICNADEVGGFGFCAGKRQKVYSTKASGILKNKRWRNVQIGHDHNPFHVSQMLLTFGDGTISNAVGIIHSCPGSTKPRLQPDHKKGLHPDWWQITTTSGSMTRFAFEKWCRYIVHYFCNRGRCRKDDPIILLLDGHTSRWTHSGLLHLNNNFIYPFCIASHTSAWAQANDCGLNSKWKKFYSATKKKWRLTHTFMTFRRKHFNTCATEAMASMQVFR